MKKSRIILLLTHTGSSYFQAFSSFLLSFLIIRLYNLELWGETAFYTVLIQLLSIVLQWGSKEQLLRSFSREPASIQHLWSQSFVSRLPLLLISITGLLLFSPAPLNWLLASWLLLLYLNKSLEVHIQYQQLFGLSWLLDLISLAITLLLVLPESSLQLEKLLSGIIAGQALKTIVLLLRFSHLFRFRKNAFDKAYLLSTFSFLMLTLLGLLDTRMDIFLINQFMSKGDLGKYQVLLSFLLIIQSMGHLMLQPFAKNVYRLEETALSKMSYSMRLSGLILVPLSLGLLFLVLEYLYQLHFEPLTYLLSGAYCMPVFFYSMQVQQLFRENKERLFMGITAGILLLHFCLMLVLIPRWGINGALLSGVCTEACRWLTYVATQRINLAKSRN